MLILLTLSCFSLDIYNMKEKFIYGIFQIIYT